MTRLLLTEPEAAEELQDAATWYDDRRAGLGTQLLDAVSATLKRVASFPESGASVPYVSVDLPARRAPVAGFPYHVVYLAEPGAIRVLAVAHDRRRPGYWLGRR